MPTDPRPTRRLLRRGCAATAVVCTALLGACGSDAPDEPVVNSVPDSTAAPGATQAPPSSGQEGTPGGQSGTNGADPGKDSEQLDPPGGTTPVPDPGGDSGGTNGQGVNPDTDSN